MLKNFTHIDIDNEKVKLIVNAALKVFSNNDYKKASTNMIVQKAGVPRGVLYYYFKNKKELFEFLLYYANDVFVQELEEKINWNEQDYLKRIKAIVLAKAEIVVEYPYVTEFLSRVLKSYSPIEYMDSFKDNQKFDEKCLNYNLDFSCVKDGVDIEMFKKLFYYSLRGEIQDIMSVTDVKTLSTKKDEITLAIDKQVAFYRQHFYK